MLADVSLELNSLSHPSLLSSNSGSIVKSASDWVDERFVKAVNPDTLDRLDIFLNLGAAKHSEDMQGSTDRTYLVNSPFGASQ